MILTFNNLQSFDNSIHNNNNNNNIGMKKPLHA